MSELQHYYDSVCAGGWQDSDPRHCGCRGRGWFLSEVDTWHQCRYHGVGVRHPEDEDEGDYPPTIVTSRDILRDLQSQELDEDDICF